MQRTAFKNLLLLGFMVFLAVTPACGGDSVAGNSLGPDSTTPVNFDLDTGDQFAIAVLLMRERCMIPLRNEPDPGNPDPEIFDACVDAIRNIGELDHINANENGDFLIRLKIRIDTGLASGLDPEFWTTLLNAWIQATYADVEG